MRTESAFLLAASLAVFHQMAQGLPLQQTGGILQDLLPALVSSLLAVSIVSLAFVPGRFSAGCAPVVPLVAFFVHCARIFSESPLQQYCGWAGTARATAGPGPARRNLVGLRSPFSDATGMVLSFALSAVLIVASVSVFIDGRRGQNS
jgi:hypothetical protein